MTDHRLLRREHAHHGDVAPHEHGSQRLSATKVRPPFQMLRKRLAAAP